MKYLVQIEDFAGKKQEIDFKTYRDALCCATNYRFIKFSKVLRKGKVINEFRF